MKYLLSLLIISVSINCYSQSNREILEDIRDELEFMQYQQELRDIERLNRARENAQDIQIERQRWEREKIERERWERENREINKMLAKQKLELEAAGRMEAERYGMSMSDYSRRLEIIEAKCPRARSDPSYFFGYCRTSIMFDISYAEAERRSKRFVSLCKGLQGTQQYKCHRDIVILNK
jgi:DNA repair exonuclease SbcCD ATPase subunit